MNEENPFAGQDAGGGWRINENGVLLHHNFPSSLWPPRRCYCGQESGFVVVVVPLRISRRCGWFGGRVSIRRSWEIAFKVSASFPRRIGFTATVGRRLSRFINCNFLKHEDEEINGFYKIRLILWLVGKFINFPTFAWNNFPPHFGGLVRVHPPTGMLTNNTFVKIILVWHRPRTELRNGSLVRE